IATLVNTREKPIKTEKQLRAIQRVGQAVNLAVERFAAVGEAMADDNPEIRMEMYDACKDARAAGAMIEQMCDIGSDFESGQLQTYADRSGMVRAARALVPTVTRILLLADTVVVKQLLTAKER
ncbi:alpha-catulin-like protein, partial [Dinothrombium tinctorium]